MITLLMDTAYLGLNLGLVKDNVLIDKLEIVAQRKQSELTLPELDDMFKRNGIKPLDITEVVITEGPGSFTGLRIAMTIAKVICSMTSAKLYTINTLLTYVHPSVEKGLAIMDARSQRAYIALIENGVLIGEAQTVLVSDIVVTDESVFGDAQLIGQESKPFSVIDNMFAYKESWTFVEDVDALVPLYLKEKQDYGH